MAKAVVDNELEMTQEEVTTEIVNNESELLRALKSDTPHESLIRTIKLKFNGVPVEFRIRPLTEDEYDRCREKNTKYQKNRRLGGMKLPESTNTTGYHSSLIYTATLDEDKAKLWDNKTLWAACNALTGTDMVDKLIPYAGKKQAIVNAIEEISGFDEEEEQNYNDTVKN